MQPNQPLCDIPTEVRPRVVAHLLMKSAFDAETGCINYTGGRTQSGYGRFLIQYDMTNTIRVRAHRAVWILTNGPIEDPALVIDHLCANRGCINPEHLELTSNEENIRRGAERRYGPQSARANRPGPTALRPHDDRTECTRGHPWPEHLRWITANGKPFAICGECRRLGTNVRRAAATQRSSCRNCAEPIYLAGVRWRHDSTRVVACNPGGYPTPGRPVALPA